MRTLIEWLTACWVYDDCSPAAVWANVISCVVRALILLVLIYVVYRVGGLTLDAL